MKIVILTRGPFPFGMASTNRLISYSKGLVELSHGVKVFCLKPTEKQGAKLLNHQVSGVYNGIEYLYAAGTTIRPNSILKRAYYSFIGFIRTLFFLYISNKEKKVDAIFMGLSNILYTYVFFLFSRIFKIKFLHERSEYPFIGVNSFLQKFSMILYLKLTCKLFDGMIVITQALQDYFGTKIRRRTRILLLPTLVEPERFTKATSSEIIRERYIAYGGDMSGNKDGVPDLIEAFNLICDKFKDVKLVLIGETNFAGFDRIKEKVIKLRLDERVVFTGRVEWDAMPSLLKQADVLALARPASKQAEGGFPIKIGEYLATGNPVVVTKVGEIPRFLKHNVHAVLIEPNNIEYFAKGLDYILSNPDIAKKIGENGQKLTFSIFNYKIQASKIVKFIDIL